MIVIASILLLGLVAVVGFLKIKGGNKEKIEYTAETILSLDTASLDDEQASSNQDSNEPNVETDPYYERFCYTAIDLAAIINSMDLGCHAKAKFLDCVWEKEQPFLQKDYRDNKRLLILDVAYWLGYFSDKPAIDAEFPVIQRDAQAMGGYLNANAFVRDSSGLDLFFKSTRLKILYGGGNPYIRIKRRDLMREYGYKRMSSALAGYFDQCIQFYRLQTYVFGYIECRIADIGIDDIITFRVSEETAGE